MNWVFQDVPYLDEWDSKISYDSGSGTFSVTFAGIPGVEYTVEYAVGSAAPPWTRLENVTAGSKGLFTVTDGPGLSGSRYYRTVYPSY